MPLKELQILTINYFVSATKIGENMIKNSNCCFSICIYTLSHQTKNLYIKKNKLVSHKQYLFSLLSSRNGKKIHTKQSILQASFFFNEETTHKLLKLAAAKKFFLQFPLVQFASMNVIYCVITGKPFPWKFIITLSVFYQTCCCFLWRKCLKVSPYFVSHLHNNNTMQISKFQNKSVYVVTS